MSWFCHMGLVCHRGKYGGFGGCAWAVWSATHLGIHLKIKVNVSLAKPDVQWHRLNPHGKKWVLLLLLCRLKPCALWGCVAGAIWGLWNDKSKWCNERVIGHQQAICILCGQWDYLVLRWCLSVRLGAAFKACDCFIGIFIVLNFNFFSQK